MNSIILPSQHFTLLTLLFAVVALGIVGEQKGWYGKISGVFITILAGALLTTAGVIPSASNPDIEVPVYHFVYQYVVPISITFLLFNARLKMIIKESGRLLVLFFIGSLGVVLGAIIAFSLISVGPDTYKMMGVFIGTYTGGSVNFMSVATALGFDQSPLFAPCVAIDNVYTNLYFVLLFTVPAISWLQRFYPIYEEDDLKDKEVIKPDYTSLTLSSLAKIFLSSLFICAVASELSPILENVLQTEVKLSILLITLFTIVGVNIFPGFFAKLEKWAFTFGMYLMYLFLAVIGAASDIKTILISSPSIIIFVTIVLIIHLSIILIFGKWLNFSLKEIAVASMANIGGPSVSAPMAASYQMKKAITPAILIAILGYIVGTFLGVGVSTLLAP